MIAELHGKISSSGVNLSENLEDNLTGNFFGSLRYIPFSKGIKKILLKVIDEACFSQYDVEEWAGQIEFWPYHKEGELDLIINLSLVTIAIEVKYNSGLSSDDQLKRESIIVKEKAKRNKTKPILLFVAKEKSGREIIKSIRDENKIEDGVSLKFISWEDIYMIIEDIYKNSELSYYEKLILEDLYKLLERKGFNNFKTFENIDSNIIEPEKFYYFKTEEQAKESEKFEFASNVEVKEGEYYEYV